MTTPQNRVRAGVPSGGEFAATAHSDSVPALQAPPGNRFAGIAEVRDLDAAASAALSAIDTSTGQDDAVRADWAERREQILSRQQRQRVEDYANTLEIQASALLSNAARANLRNIAGDLREEFPGAATVVLKKDYDDGNLAIWVKAVQDKDGNNLPETDDKDPREIAQELVSEYSSRQLARFTEAPVNLERAAAWIPDGGFRADAQ